jgi:hypothetical protein
MLILTILMPRRLTPFRALLMLPSLRSAYGRARITGGGTRVAAYFLLHDLVEVSAVARAGLRYRRVML